MGVLSLVPAPVQAVRQEQWPVVAQVWDNQPVLLSPMEHQSSEHWYPTGNLVPHPPQLGSFETIELNIQAVPECMSTQAAVEIFKYSKLSYLL